MSDKRKQYTIDKGPDSCRLSVYLADWKPLSIYSVEFADEHKLIARRSHYFLTRPEKYEWLSLYRPRFDFTSAEPYGFSGSLVWDFSEVMVEGEYSPSNKHGWFSLVGEIIICPM